MVLISVYVLDIEYVNLQIIWKWMANIRPGSWDKMRRLLRKYYYFIQFSIFSIVESAGYLIPGGCTLALPVKDLSQAEDSCLRRETRMYLSIRQIVIKLSEPEYWRVVRHFSWQLCHAFLRMESWVVAWECCVTSKPQLSWDVWAVLKVRIIENRNY